jgi:hypothetical protein
MAEIEEKAKDLVLHLLGRPEKKMRASSFKEKLHDLPPEEVVEILNLICLRANARDPIFMQTYESLPELFQSFPFSEAEIRRFREVARDRNYPEIFQILFNLPPHRLLPDGSELLEDPSLKELTLGHRKSLAHSPNLSLLKRLLRQQDPAVIHSLLLNPRLTESDVLKVASLKPTSPRVLREVFSNPKWISRYRVKKALVYNPYCPPSIGLHLLKFMLVGDLREISRDENLHLLILEAAYQLLTDKEIL